MIRVLLADDHAMVRDCQRRILEATGSVAVAGEAADVSSALALAREVPAEVLVLDLTMPGGNVFDLIGRIRGELPRLRILVSSMHAEPRYASRAFRAGASGYLSKERAGTELVAAVGKLARGGFFVGLKIERYTGGRAGEPAEGLPHERLSNREVSVLHRIVDGQSISEIAGALDLSPKTVSAHRARILEKMELPHDAALIRYAVRHHLFDDLQS